MSSCSLPPLEPLGDVLLPEAFRPNRATTPEWRSFSSMPIRRTNTGISAAFSPSPDSSMPGQHLSLSEGSELSGSHGEGIGSELTQHSILAPWGPPDNVHCGDPAVDESLRRLSLAEVKPRKTSAGVSRARVPGMGTVFKVSLPASDTNGSCRSSLHDAAEAAVWARTGMLSPPPPSPLAGCACAVFACFVSALE